MCEYKDLYLEMCPNFKKQAFTLAEVLITLGIIGVVAAITIPTVINNVNEIQYKVAYKKAFSVASQAFLSASSQSLFTERVSATLEANKVTNFAAFMTQFKVTKDCSSNSDNSLCWASGENFNGVHSSTTPAFVDSSGMSWKIYEDPGWDGLLVDTNGFKNPNKCGQDRFYFYITDTNGNGFLGIPMNIVPHQDITVQNASCPSGDVHTCLYTSWLLQ